MLSGDKSPYNKQADTSDPLYMYMHYMDDNKYNFEDFWNVAAFKYGDHLKKLPLEVRTLISAMLSPMVHFRPNLSEIQVSIHELITKLQEYTPAKPMDL